MGRSLATVTAFVLLLGSGTWSCDFLDGGGGSSFLIEEPTVNADKPELSKSPSVMKLAAYYCPQILDDPLVRQTCTVLVGPVPDPAELHFRFRLVIHVANPNDFPLPAIELLAVLHLFPNDVRTEVAAVCVTFCDQGGDSCAASGPDACASDDPEILSREDLIEAAFDFLTIYVENATSGESPPELAVQLIPARGQGTLAVTFDLAPDPVMEALYDAIKKNWEAILKEGTAAIKVPYELEGTVWFVVKNFGRFGIGFGPVSGEWSL